MRGVPCSRYCPCPKATSAVRNRTLVPLLAMYKIGLVRGNDAPLACDIKRRIRQIGIEFKTQRFERFDHHSRIFAVEHANELRLAIGQRGTNERPIGDALRARRTNTSAHRSCGGCDFDDVFHGRNQLTEVPMFGDWPGVL